MKLNNANGFTEDVTVQPEAQTQTQTQTQTQQQPAAQPQQSAAGQQPQAAQPQQDSAQDLLGGGQQPYQFQTTGFQGGNRYYQPAAGQQQQARQYDPLNIRQLLFSARSRSNLCKFGQDYHVSLATELERYGVKLDICGADGVYLAHKGDKGFMIIYNELMPAPQADDDYTPAIVNYDRLLQDPLVLEACRKLTGRKPIDVVIIPKTDYVPAGENANQVSNLAEVTSKIAATSIRNTLTMYEGAEISLNDLANLPIRFLTSATDVQEALERNHPAGVLPHQQIGFVAQINTDPKASQQMTPWSNQAQQDRYGNWQFLLAVTAYIDFVCQGWDHNDLWVYPVVTISDVESPIRSVKMLPIILASATFQFINSGMWQTPFHVYGKQQPNIGSLAFNRKDNTVMFVDNQQQFADFCRLHVANPALAVDYRIGSFTHPAISAMFSSADSNMWRQELDTFLGGSMPGMQFAYPIASVSEMVTGNVLSNGQYVDTRSIDYFTLVSKNVIDMELLDHFRNHYANPIDRIKAIADAGWQQRLPSSVRSVATVRPLESLYRCMTGIINIDLLSSMLTIAGQMKIINNFSRNATFAWNFSDLQASSNRLHDLCYNQHQTYGPYNQGYNPNFGGFGSYGPYRR